MTMHITRCVVVIVGLLGLVSGRYPEGYPCPVCVQYSTKVFFSDAATRHPQLPRDVCTEMRACAFISTTPLANANVTDRYRRTAKDALAFCKDLGLCVRPELERHRAGKTGKATSQPFGLRVSRGYGSRGYQSVRVSAVVDASLVEHHSPALKDVRDTDYSSLFQWRWTNKYLFSKLVDVTPGTTTNVTIVGHNVPVWLPLENAPTRGIFVADICFSSIWIPCQYGDQLHVFQRLPPLLNLALTRPGDADYWMNLGDMFYDRDTTLPDEFYNELSMETQSVITGATAGNHDYWVYGVPWFSFDEDQFGNGYMQYFTMDTAAALNSTNGLFNFSVDPNHYTGLDYRARLPDPSNYFFYHKIGNVALMGYSGAYTWAQMAPYFEEGCQWLASANASVNILVGHWNDGGAGCDDDMTVPAVYAQLRQNFAACSGLGDSFKYIMGHTHCNQIVEQDRGYMVAGQGMEGCGNFGITYVDTHDDRLEILYYPIADQDGLDNYEQLLQCVAQYGFSGCKFMARVWYNASFSNLTSS